MTTVISLWLDKTSEPNEASWIVSRDDEKGSVTLDVYDDDEYETARAEAIRTASDENLVAVEIDEQGQRARIA